METKKVFWFRKHPGKALVLFVLAFLLIVLVVLEIGLRASGYKPGLKGIPENITLVDSLKLLDDYQNNELGILKVRYGIRNKACRFLQSDPALPKNVEDLRLDFSLEKVVTEFDRLQSGELKDEEFSAFYQNLLDKPAEEWDGVDSAYQAYVQCPINSLGFRSIPFQNHRTDKTKVFLLGDSFTWGLAAHPQTNSFADRLAARGFAVYNSGIIGADPAQYLAICQHYMQVVQPDVVVINFFMGNDQMDWIRVPHKEHPLMYPSNAGWLGGYIEGCYVSPQESYDINLSGISIPRSLDDLWTRFCRQTVLGTRLWFATAGRKAPLYLPHQTCDPKYDPPISEHFIREIQKVCDRDSVQLITALIPYHKQLPGFPGEIENFEQSAPKNFPSVEYHFPSDLNPSDYQENDDHFNNAGMKKYADFLEKLIREKVAAKAP